MKRFSTFLLVTSMVVICCIPLHLNSSAAEIKPIITHPILVENDLFAILNLDYCPALSDAGLMSISDNDSNEWPHDDLDNIESTSGIPITTAVSYIDDYLPEEAETEQENFEWLCAIFGVRLEAIEPLPTVSYNCHAYAWYGAPDNGSCWIKDPSEFFDDPHCDEISDNIEDDAVQEGDIVYFYNSQGAVHSSIVDSITYFGEEKEIHLRSKFGADGLYIHPFNDTIKVYNYTNYTVYRYVQDEHDLYMYSADTEDYVVKCHDCTYTVECWESPEYYGDSEDGHWVDCPCGCYSFFEPHTPGNYYNTEEGYHEIECADCGYLYTEDCSYGSSATSGNSYYHFYECTYCGYERAEAHSYICSGFGDLYNHTLECSVCGDTDTEPHDWIRVGTKYRCLDCGRQETIIPTDIMNLSDEELSLLLSSMSAEELEQFIALLPEDAVARVTAILPPDDEHLTE